MAVINCCVLKDDECEEGEIKEMVADYSPRGDSRPPIERPLSPPSVCRFYLRGTCTWGDNCRFHHPGTYSQIFVEILFADFFLKMLKKFFCCSENEKEALKSLEFS